MIKGFFNKKQSRGLPGGPNQQFTYVTGVFMQDMYHVPNISTEGYKSSSPDVNNPFNIIPSGNITMKGVDFPVRGVDNLGNEKIMYPGEEHQFPGDMVYETPVAQKGKSFEDWYKSLPTEKSDTSLYNLRRAFELAPKKDLHEFTNDPNSHLYTVYPNNKGEYEFIKSKNHPTLQKELDWYYSNEGSDFRSKYELDTSEDFYKYVPRKPKAQKGYQVKPRKGVRKNPDGTESTHLMMREFVPDKGWVVFPSLFQNQDSSWIDFNKTHDLKKTGFNPVYQEAIKRGEVYEFGDDLKSAIKFSDEGSWKKQDGGSIKLDPAKKGTFKALATKYGMSMDKLAMDMKKNPDKYSPGARKKANFYRNFVMQYGGSIDNKQFEIYKNYINGVFDEVSEQEAEKVYDKLNRMYYAEAKEKGMAPANYIMTHIIGSN